METFRRDLAGFIVLACFSLAAGVVINQVRRQPLPLAYTSKAIRLEQAVTNVRAVAPADSNIASMPAAEIREIDLEEFRRLMAQPKAVVLDARPEIFHRLGHIPRALTLPRDEFDTYYQKNRATLEALKNELLLIYCQSNACEDSHLVASALTRLGYTKLAIFTGGWNQWTEKRLPEERL